MSAIYMVFEYRDGELSQTDIYRSIITVIGIYAIQLFVSRKSLKKIQNNKKK